MQGSAGHGYLIIDLCIVIPREDIFPIHTERLVQRQLHEVWQLGWVGQGYRVSVCKLDVKGWVWEEEYVIMIFLRPAPK